MGENLEDESKLPENGRVLRRDPDGVVTVLVKGQSLPDGLDISHSAQRMFWTNMGSCGSAIDRTIMSAKLDGKDVKVLISAGKLHTPKQLIVEESSQRLYFCDREGLGVHRCDFDGANHEILVSTGDPSTADTHDATKWCVVVAVDARNGKIYWTQKGPSKGGKGQILCANLEIPTGESAKSRTDIEILAKDLPEPIDLDLDKVNQLLYWTDRGEYPTGCSLNRISVEAHGNRVPKMVARHFHEPIGLKLDLQLNIAYVTDLGGAVYRVHLDDGKKDVLLSDGACYSGIALGYR